MSRLNFRNLGDIAASLRQAIKPAKCRWATPDDLARAVLEVEDIIQELSEQGHIKVGTPDPS